MCALQMRTERRPCLPRTPLGTGATVVGRIGKPMEDLGTACVYLASRAGSFITGAVLPVDGGLLVSRDANL